MKTYEELMKQKWKWSIEQFGKGYSYDGLKDHILKEIAELDKEPYDLEEWIDMMFLVTDGAHRVVKMHYPQLKPEEIVAVVRTAFQQKLKINRNRKWGKHIPGKAVEHIRHEKEEKFDMVKAHKDAGFADTVL